MSKKLQLAQGELEQAEANLERKSKESKNKDLVSIKDIEGARKHREYAKYAVGDHSQVIENLKLAIANAGTSLQGLRSKKTIIQNRIWRNYIEVLSDEIRNVLGERMYEYWCATFFAIPGAIGICNFGQREEMNNFINSKDDLNEYRNKLFSKIINNGVAKL